EGETEQRLYGLDAWREAPYYSDRERAALEWTEALTQITDGHVSDDVYERAKRQFSEKELVELALIAVAINGWNRLAIAFRSQATSGCSISSAASCCAAGASSSFTTSRRMSICSLQTSIAQSTSSGRSQGSGSPGPRLSTIVWSHHIRNHSACMGPRKRMRS